MEEELLIQAKIRANWEPIHNNSFSKHLQRPKTSTVLVLWSCLGMSSLRERKERGARSRLVLSFYRKSHQHEIKDGQK